jgi:hypothetical protein
MVTHCKSTLCKTSSGKFSLFKVSFRTGTGTTGAELPFSRVSFGSFPFAKLRFGSFLFAKLPFGSFSFAKLQFRSFPFAKLPFGKLVFGKLSFGKLAFGTLSFGKLAFGKLSLAVSLPSLDIFEGSFIHFRFGNGKPSMDLFSFLLFNSLLLRVSSPIFLRSSSSSSVEISEFSACNTKKKFIIFLCSFSQMGSF